VSLSHTLLRPVTALARLRPPEPQPAGRAHAQDVTTVVRPPIDLAADLLARLEPLRQAHAAHRWYAPASLHVTVLNLNQLALAGLEPPAIDRLVADVAARHQPFAVELRGLALSPSSILVRCHVTGDALWTLRDDLRRARRLGGTRHGTVGDTAKRRLVHLNVARLAGPADAELRRAVLERTSEAYGSFTAHSVELVRTDRAATPEATTLYGRHALTGQ
jgi:2'-5' RNA ligase